MAVYFADTGPRRLAFPHAFRASQLGKIAGSGPGEMHWTDRAKKCRHAARVCSRRSAHSAARKRASLLFCFCLSARAGGVGRVGLGSESRGNVTVRPVASRPQPKNRSIWRAVAREPAESVQPAYAEGETRIHGGGTCRIGVLQTSARRDQRTNLSFRHALLS